MCTGERLKNVDLTDTWLSSFAYYQEVGILVCWPFLGTETYFCQTESATSLEAAVWSWNTANQHLPETTVGDCVSPDWPDLQVLADRHRGPVGCILKTHAKIQGKDTLDPLARAPDGSSSSSFPCFAYLVDSLGMLLNF